MSINTRLQSKIAINKTTTKTDLSTHYQIDRATFIKWLIIFCDDIFSDKSDLLNRRKFTNLEIVKIKNKLGSEGQSFRKADLVRLADTNYLTIRESIRSFPSSFGISEREYRILSKFPPKIAQRIIEGLG